MNWKLVAPTIASLAFALSSLGCAAEVVVHRRPPTERVEVVTSAPSANHIWIRGHWQWNGSDYVWNPGHWETRQVNASWSPGHWRESGSGWVWVPGRWVTR